MKKDVQPKLVVGVGASAGGLEAFKQFLGSLTAESGMTFLLVQHLDPNHKSLLAELLAPLTEMVVRDADQGLFLEPDTVYIIRPDTALAVRGGKIQLTQPTLHRGVRLPVDHLFSSLAKEYGPRSVGIVLLGAGSDGSAGIRDIKAAGGLVIAQEPRVSGQPGMPQSAIDTGLVDLVLEIPEMPATLARFAALSPTARFGSSKDLEGGGERVEQLASLDEQAMSRLAAILEAQMSFDLRVYKPATIERRVLRRMALSDFDSIEPYLDHLRSAPEEQQTLVRDLLISVTEFFRDPDAFRALREMVIDPLVANSSPGATLRVWVPACATGEEAYSIAMEFLDAIESHDKRASLQIFATDVDQEALAFARAAIYPASIADHVSRQRLQVYFKRLDGKGYQVRPMLRDVVSFAAHDLTKDPPFSRMGLVSCRNVLIYLTSEAQKHVLEVLHFALEPGGHLFLSTSESTGPQREFFSTLSKSQRIYRKVGASRPIQVARSRNKLRGAGRDAEPAATPVRRRPSGGDLARRAVLDAIAPPTLVVEENGSILFSHGELGSYLRIPSGDNPRFELGSILRESIATRVRGVLYRCRRSKEPQFAMSSPDEDDPSHRVRIAARPAPSMGDGVVILTFEKVPEEALVTVAERAEGVDEDVVQQLEKELLATREDLHNTVEELESSNEELRSSNEESMSMNEELQSANEELEATTEELRSLNEELTTVNAQLREKIEQVELAHDDLNNFFSSTKVATVFLDERLCIKRFTPAAQEFLGIDHADTGRFVGDIARDLLQRDLARDARAVLDDLTTKSREVRTADGRYITRRALPYRTESRRIEGVVVTFTDVTALREANEALRTKSRRLELAWEAARGGVLEHGIPLDESTFVSDQWAQVLGYRLDELPPYETFLSWFFEQAHPDDRERFEQTFNDLVEARSERYVIELRFRHKGGHWIWVRKIAKVLERDERGRPRHLLRMMIDITDLKEIEASLRESELRFREMADGLPLMVWVHDQAGDQEYVNQTFCTFFGVSREEMKGGRWQILVHPEDVDSYTREFYACVADKRPFHAEARVKHADGTWRWIESWGRPRLTPSGAFRGLVGASADISDRREMETALRASEERLQIAREAAGFGVYAHDIVSGEIAWDERIRSTWGVSADEPISFDLFMDGLHPDDRVATQEAIDRALDPDGDGRYRAEYRVINRRDGEIYWVHSTGFAEFEDGAATRLVGAAQDVTAEKEAKAALVASQARLEEADRQKDEFLAMLGHELRNPLAAIRTASELLLFQAEDEPQMVRIQEVLERQTAHMAKLLDGLLDVSRIIRGKIKLEPEVLDLREVCREVTSDITESIPDRRLEIRTEIPSRPLHVVADRVRMTQVINNLLFNAVKYTPDGGVIRVVLDRDDGMAVLTVADTGVGIEPELLGSVFEIFRQSKQSIDRSQGGLGLGLALVKTLVELHGGRVEARSDGPGRGAEFSVALPLSRAPARSAPEDGEAIQETLRILIIEDNQDAADVLAQVLELSGHEVTIANCGETGVALARERQPDVVLCDLGLPDGMSGFDVARELRSDERLAGMGLIALSGYGWPEDKARCEEAGFDAHLTKPVDIASLERALATVQARDPRRDAE